VSRARKLVPSTMNILILNARKHVQRMATQGECFLLGYKCQIAMERMKGQQMMIMHKDMDKQKQDEARIRFKIPSSGMQCNITT